LATFCLCWQEERVTQVQSGTRPGEMSFRGKEELKQRVSRFSGDAKKRLTRPAELRLRRGGEPTQLPNLASELSPVRLGVREDTRRRIWIPERDQLDSPLTEIGGQH
jgi:hypothetical protein